MYSWAHDILEWAFNADAKTSYGRLYVVDILSKDNGVGNELYPIPNESLFILKFESSVFFFISVRNKSN